MQKIFGNKINKRFVLTGIASALLLGACGNADASEETTKNRQLIRMQKRLLLELEMPTNHLFT